MSQDPYIDSVEGIFKNKLGITSAATLRQAEADITNAALSMAKEDWLRHLARDPFVDRLTYYFGEINALHPFREGNGHRLWLRSSHDPSGWSGP